MNDTLINAMKSDLNRDARTENGAVTLRSTRSSVLDFFSQAGAFRERSEHDIIKSFSKAFAEDRNLAMRALFYLRDIRGGQGERRMFRVIASWLARNYPSILRANLSNIPFYGRWDDMFFDESMIELSSAYLDEAVKSMGENYESLTLAKWLPSENASSRATAKRSRLIREKLGMSARQYRKMLSAARKELGIVESQMSAGQFSSIDYSKVPSRASVVYRKAFSRRDGDRYSSFIQKVKNGEAKINAAVTYPYEIVREYFDKGSNDETLNVLWENLPNYIVAGQRMLVMADVSGSMNINNRLPMATSISLAMYAAERNTDSPFYNHFMTFSAKPDLVEIKGRNLFERISNLERADWDMSTNLVAAFERILQTAKKAQISQEQMPTQLVVVSDMEFDAASRYSTNFEHIKQLYAEAGYEMPTLVFWNVNARNSHSPVEFNQKGVKLVSGSSPSIFKALMSTKTLTPYDLMLEVLQQERYDRVVSEE